MRLSVKILSGFTIILFSVPTDAGSPTRERFYPPSDSTPASSFQLTKKHAKIIWADHRESFYCGCQFDEHLNVDYTSCHYKPVDIQKAQRIEWEHLVPVSWFGHNRACWQNAKYLKRDPRAHCEKIDPEFRMMLNDLHNLVPAIGEVNKARSNYRFEAVYPRTQFNGCELSIDPIAKTVEPKDNLKGMVARAHLYMAKTYNVELTNQQIEQFYNWDKQYPASEWEIMWKQRITIVQG